MSRFAGERAVVLGLGTSGMAAARVLFEEGASVRVSERRRLSEAADLEQLSELEELGVEVRDGGHEPEHLDSATLVVTSPGVPEGSPVIAWAVERGLPIWSELELGSLLCEVPYVAVTGTNGKTTTTEMVAAAMREGGLDAVACGNIGHPFSLAAREGHEALAVEASSFQLTFHRTFHPRVSVLLNLAPDHLDWHGSHDRYAAAKARVFELQGQGDTHVASADDPAAGRVSARARAAVVRFGLGSPSGDGDAGYDPDGRLVVRRDGELLALGAVRGASAGFRADAAAAAAASLAFGIDPDALGRAMSSIEPLPHRGDVVAEVDGIRFVDDSKATNPHAALAALESLHDAVLVAGGLSKGVDLSPLTAALPALAGVVVLGESAPEIAALFEGTVPVRKASSVEEAAELGLELAPPGGVVVLAPACASQDMYRDYRERGERFASAARALHARRPHGD